MSLPTIMKQQRQMAILSTIRTLQFATRRHLMAVHDLGGIRNANRVIKDLKPYVNIAYYKKEHVYYLNRAGRELFADTERIPLPTKLPHFLLRNEAWLWLNCPDNWQIESEIRYTKDGAKKRIIADAKYKDEYGILHAVEIDRAQKMKANEEKLKKYAEYTQLYKQTYNGKKPVIHFFTISSYRQQKLEQLASKYDVYVRVYFIPEV